ncbi:MAG: phosphoglucosamine mutase [Methanobacterium sp.]|uniref:phosphoglucosamine mutase n=1 Tax=Methanobacterium sp. TaxID=2164 RepID=UPI003D645E04|nr:phosphoglucosamine mutase [Methanobacterium sp.]
MDEMIPKLFGTSGIRGKLVSELTLELITDIGMAVATYIGGKGRKIVIGYDTRTSNKMVENAITAGILQCGCNVIRLGMVPTPLVGYAAMKLGADLGIMITASHNPSQYNGIKLWNSTGMAYTQDQERTIEKIVHEKSFSQASWEFIGKIEDNEGVVFDYINDLLDNVDIKGNLKVVVDCASGAGSYISPIVLRKAGCHVLTLNCQPDGFFPGRMPEPSQANLSELMKVVKATGADIGIAHDGDADRMVAIDDQGRMADFDKLLALVSSKIGGKVVTTVDASFCVDKCMEDVGGEVIRTKVGDVHVAEVIVESNASFGGEPSGTWLHPDFCMCPDGILSALKVIEIVEKYGPLSKLLDEIPSYPTIRDRIECENIQKTLIMEKVKEELPDYFDNVLDVNFIDGVRISMEDGSWVLIRPSGTESYIRITLEGKTMVTAKEIQNKSREFIEGIL